MTLPGAVTTIIMSSHSYEVALFGEFFSQDLKPVLNRITLHSDSSQQIHTREIVFEPLDVHIQRDSAVLLRAKKELSQPNSTWYSFHHFNLIYSLFIGNQGTLFLLETRVSTRPSRGYCQTVVHLSSHW